MRGCAGEVNEGVPPGKTPEKLRPRRISPLLVAASAAGEAAESEDDDEDEDDDEEDVKEEVRAARGGSELAREWQGEAVTEPSVFLRRKALQGQGDSERHTRNQLMIMIRTVRTVTICLDAHEWMNGSIAIPYRTAACAASNLPSVSGSRR